MTSFHYKNSLEFKVGFMILTTVDQLNLYYIKSLQVDEH